MKDVTYYCGPDAIEPPEPTPQTDENVSPRTADEIEALIVPHGPSGECSNPELCVALTELRVAERREALDPHIHPPGTTDKRCRACREAEAAPALDVEMTMTFAVHLWRHRTAPLSECDCRKFVRSRAIVREYVRLSTEPSPHE